jgi:DNA-binding response OmpR family regulator
VNAKACPARPKILCIDDDPAITMAIRLRLDCYEVDVLTATDGADGMWMAMNEQPEVIITDLRMPNGDGDYVVECLKGRSDTSEIPVIALTGRSDNETKCWMQTLGVKHYLRKPLQIAKLLTSLDDYIELRPACDSVKT